MLHAGSILAFYLALGIGFVRLYPSEPDLSVAMGTVGTALLLVWALSVGSVKGLKEGSTFTREVVWALAAFSGMLVVAIAWSSLGWAQQTSVDPTDLTGFALVVAAYVLLPLGGVLEEVLFRGLFLRSLVRSWGPVLAVLATSVIFAAGHVVSRGGWEVVPLYFAIGLVLGGVAVARQGILAVVLAHALWNLLLG